MLLFSVVDLGTKYSGWHAVLKIAVFITKFCIKTRRSDCLWDWQRIFFFFLKSCSLSDFPSFICWLMTSHVRITHKWCEQARERFGPSLSFVLALSVCLLLWLCSECVCVYVFVKQRVTCFWGFNTNDPQIWTSIVPRLLICLCSPPICLCGPFRTRQSRSLPAARAQSPSRRSLSWLVKSLWRLTEHREPLK